ncbi:MAG: hypothetical protein H6566_29810 [Lewinellaceae bacterium]|nr:hypothetical protein [Lewinellaceae bacterium]
MSENKETIIDKAGEATGEITGAVVGFMGGLVRSGVELVKSGDLNEASRKLNETVEYCAQEGGKAGKQLAVPIATTLFGIVIGSSYGKSEEKKNQRY